MFLILKRALSWDKFNLETARTTRQFHTSQGAPAEGLKLEIMGTCIWKLIASGCYYEGEKFPVTRTVRNSGAEGRCMQACIDASVDKSYEILGIRIYDMILALLAIAVKIFHGEGAVSLHGRMCKGSAAYMDLL